MASKDVEVQSTELVKLSPRAVNIMDGLGLRLTDPSEVAWRIGERLARASSLDELLDDTGPMGLKQHLGVVFTIRSVDWLPGKYENGPGFYALIGAVTADGEPVDYTSGAMNVVMQLARGMSQGWFADVQVKAEQTDEPTSNGYYPYRLVRA